MSPIWAAAFSTSWYDALPARYGDLSAGKSGKKEGPMNAITGVSPAATQASAAVFNIDAMAKQPPPKRDDVVAPIDTTNRQAAKTDISLLKMSDNSLGQNIDIKV
jgi:hypothetical protein